MDLFSHKLFRHVVFASGLWAILSSGVLFSFRNVAAFEASPQAFYWLVFFVFIGALGLFSLGKLVAGLFLLTGDGAEKNRGQTLFRTFTWGAVKLACIGLLVGVATFVKAVPGISLLLGMATLVVVPLTVALIEKYREYSVNA